MTTARANHTTGLTNGITANCAPEVEFCPFRALSRRPSNDVPVLLLNQPIIPYGTPGEFYCSIFILVSVDTGNFGEEAIVGLI